MTATARGMIGWRHAFGDTTPAIASGIRGRQQLSRLGRSDSRRNAAVMEFGLDMQVGARATLGLSYDGQLGQRQQ